MLTVLSRQRVSKFGYSLSLSLLFVHPSSRLLPLASVFPSSFLSLELSKIWSVADRVIHVGVPVDSRQTLHLLPGLLGENLVQVVLHDDRHLEACRGACVRGEQQIEQIVRPTNDAWKEQEYTGIQIKA